MKNKELETWLEETKAKNLSYDELVEYIANDKSCSIKIYTELEKLTKGRMGKECAQILFNQWQKEAEFSPKRGDRVLVWDLFEEKAVEKIFLTEIKGCITPIKVVGEGSEIEFENNEIFISEGYKHMKPLPAKHPKETDFKSQVIELIEETIREYGEAKEVAVNEEDYGDAAKYILIKETFEVFLKVVKEQLC